MTDHPLAPLLTEDAMLSVRHADDLENYPYDYMTRRDLYAELDAQRAALAELRAKVGRTLSNPTRLASYDAPKHERALRCDWCGYLWRDIVDPMNIQSAVHPANDCLYHDWLAAQPAPPGREEE